MDLQQEHCSREVTKENFQIMFVNTPVTDSKFSVLRRKTSMHHISVQGLLACKMCLKGPACPPHPKPKICCSDAANVGSRSSSAAGYHKAECSSLRAGI